MTLSVQLNTMMAMILTGIWIGAAVDTYGRFMHTGRMTWLLFLGDILFWILQGMLIFFVLLQVNEGDIRFYIFLALLCGFAAYRALFQNLYKNMLDAVIRIVNAIIRFLNRLFMSVVVKPIGLFLKLVLLIAGALGSALWTIATWAAAPLKSVGFLMWRLLPAPIKNVKKSVAGFRKIVQNKIRNWFGRT